MIKLDGESCYIFLLSTILGKYAFPNHFEGLIFLDGTLGSLAVYIMESQSQIVFLIGLKDLCSGFEKTNEVVFVLLMTNSKRYVNYS